MPILKKKWVNQRPKFLLKEARKKSKLKPTLSRIKQVIKLIVAINKIEDGQGNKKLKVEYLKKLIKLISP